VVAEDVRRIGTWKHRHSMTLKRLQEHLARADGELEAAQRFLDPGTQGRATRWPW
jgi:hypothetical protein